MVVALATLQHGLRSADLRRRESWRAAEFLASSFRSCEVGNGAFAHDVVFELSDCTKEVYSILPAAVPVLTWSVSDSSATSRLRNNSAIIKRSCSERPRRSSF